MPESRFPYSPTPYEVLGVGSDASMDDIKRAYRKAQRQTHPDMGGDPEEFARVTTAFDLIGTMEARKAFDADLASRNGRSSRSSSTSSAPRSTRTASPSSSSSSSSAPEPARIVPPLADGPLTVTWGKRSVIVDAPVVQRTVHGKPQRGLFSVKTTEAHDAVSTYLAERLVPNLPAARIFHEVSTRKAPGRKNPHATIPTLVVAGDRIAIVEVLMLTPDVYVWDGRRLARSTDQRPVELPNTTEQQRALVQVLPEVDQVGSFVALMVEDHNALAPELQETGPHDPAASGLHEAPHNLRGLTRSINMFLGLGSQHSVVDRNLVGKLELLRKGRKT